MNCSVFNCSIRASFECTCQNSHKIYCKDHLINHLSTSAPPHNNRQLEIPINQQVSTSIINALEALNEKISVSKKQLIEDFSRIISVIEVRFKSILETLNDYSKSLNKVIIDIKTAPSLILDSRIKQTLFSESNKANSEIAKWDVFSFYLNNIELNESIKKWGYVEEDFNFLFTLDQRKVKSKFTGQKNKTMSVSDNVNEKSIDYPSEYEVKRINPPIPTSTTSQKFSKLSCSNGHDLKWSVNIPFKYFRVSGSFTIICDLCKKEFSSSCWNCEKCSYDVCESCGLSQGCPAPNLKCDNNHELFWHPDTPHYYKSINKGHRFKCKSCDLIKSEANWHCRECNFDICSVCAKKKNGQEPLTFLKKCENNHELVKRSIQGFNVNGFICTPTCDCCKVTFTGECKFCEYCNYMLCSQCIDYYNSPTPGHPLFTCHNGDVMRWTRVEEFQCDACFKEFQDEHYKCRECNFDLCFECSSVLIRCVLKRKLKNHGDYKHQLEWNWRAGSENSENATLCSICGIFYKTGMFSCTICDNNYCLLCYNDPNRPKPKADSYQSAGNTTLAMNLLLNILNNS